MLCFVLVLFVVLFPFLFAGASDYLHASYVCIYIYIYIYIERDVIIIICIIIVIVHMR